MKAQTTIVALALAFVVGCASSPDSRYERTFANPQFIVSTEELADRLSEDRLVILDTRGADDYAAGHIPGAIHLPPAWLERVEILDNGEEVKNLVLGAEDITPVLQDAGIGRRSRVVIYDAGRHVLAARVFWMLDYYGHQNIAVLDGGFAGWTARGKETSTAAPDIEPGNFVAKPNPDKIADYEYIQANLGDTATALCNALGAASFASGAIPGSVNLPQGKTFTIGHSPVLISADEMLEMMDQVGLTHSSEIVFYCGAGYAAAQDYFVARALGLRNVRLYDGSLRDWRARGGELTPGGGPSS